MGLGISKTKVLLFAVGDDPEQAPSNAAVDTAIDAVVDDLASHTSATIGAHGMSAFGSTLVDDTDAATARGTLGLGSAATKTAPASGNAAAGEVVLGSDTRLTDSRTPTAHTHDDRYFTESEIIAGYQPLDATTTALAAWDWSSGVEVATFTADDTLSILRVGTSANNLVQLDGSGKLPAVDGSQLTNLPGGASNLDGLSDVTITSPASGQYTRYNGTAWVNAAIVASDLPSGIDRTKIGNGSDVVETFCYKQSSSVDYNGTSGSFTIEPADLQMTVPSTGLWQITALINVQKASTGAATAIRLAMNTAVISGTTGWPAGGHFSAGVTANCTITTGSPTIVSGASRSPGSNDICFAVTWNLNVTTAGTIKFQMSDGSGTANIFKLLNTSTIVGKRLSA
jgi:hypothetical protein